MFIDRRDKFAAFLLFLPLIWLAGPIASARKPQLPGQVTPIPRPVGKDYRKLTDSQRSFTNFNVEVVRGFFLKDVGALVPDVYAIHAYESSLVYFQGLAPEPTQRWRTVSNPVSIAAYAEDLLVVGQGNHALARHDLPDGEIIDLLALPSEPADIVVDTDNDEAWVSCMGDDCVVQIDLSSPMRIKKIWSWDEGLELKRPRFLFLDPQTSSPDDNLVYVAPMVSGNNTIFKFNTGPGPDIVDGTSLPAGGLPDEDLFRISTGPDQVEPVIRAAGSLLFGHGKNPVTGDYWMVGLDHLNLEPGMLSEPTVRGKFAMNQLAITSAALFSAGGSPPPEPDSTIDLDDYDVAAPGAQYQSDRSVSFPYALAFEPGTGRAAIAASTSPLVVLTDSAGQRVQEFQLQSNTSVHRGAVARTLAFSSAGLYVYCQETSNILAFRLTGGPPIVSLGLGNDPTPDPVRHGRRTWYDATRSLDGRTSCNVCHPQGGADGLAWLISNDPVDEKGNMVTQTLMGVEDSFPYHWRGERDLEAFNGAFPGLLGTANKLDEQNGELADFVEFVFSLTPPANPLQNGRMDIDAQGRLVQDLDRRLKSRSIPFDLGEGLIPTGFFPHNPQKGNPVMGDDVFHDIPIVFGRTCQECHLNPTGTNGDVLNDGGGPINSEAVLKVAHLDTQLPLKHQPIVQVDFGAGPTEPRNLLGFGTSHKGNRHNLFHFNLRFFPAMTPEQIFDLTAFVHMADHGVAPSIHFAERLHPGSPNSARTRIRKWLLAQARRNWVGVVAFGTFPDRNGNPARIHWEYDPATRRFLPDDAVLQDPQPFSAFRDFANHPELDNVFLGVPPGNENRLGVDFDDDGLDTGEEIAAGTDVWNPDTDGDGWPDGYEIDNPGDPLDATVPPQDVTIPQLVGPVRLDFANASLAKLHFEADEPVTWEITLTAPNLPTIVEDRLTADRTHTAVVQRLAPSTIGFNSPVDVLVQYTGTLVLRDLSNNASPPIPIPLITTESQIHNGAPDNLVVGLLELVNEVRTPTTYAATANLRIDFREQAPPPLPAAGRVIVAQLLKQQDNGLDWDIVPASDITHDAPASDFGFGPIGLPYGQTPGLLPGPFMVLNLTDLLGLQSVNFSVSQLNPAQKVMFNVLTVFEVPGNWDPMNPVLPPNQVALDEYQLPATPGDNRRIVSG